MKIYEYQAHEIFSSHGIPTPPMEVADSAEKAEEITKRFGRPVAVKAQVLVGGRGEAGGIKIARDPGQAQSPKDLQAAHPSLAWFPELPGDLAGLFSV